MYRIVAGLGISTSVVGGIYFYQRYPHNKTAIKLANIVVESAETHLNISTREIREKKRLFGKAIEKSMSGSKLMGPGCEMNLTEKVWGCVVSSGEEGHFRVITRVDQEPELVVEVHISA
ncbi:MAG: hypothetical protein ChlgKO_00470 [Chlamydiales bacterium]